MDIRGCTGQLSCLSTENFADFLVHFLRLLSMLIFRTPRSETSVGSRRWSSAPRTDGSSARNILTSSDKGTHKMADLRHLQIFKQTKLTPKNEYENTVFFGDLSTRFSVILSIRQRDEAGQVAPLCTGNMLQLQFFSQLRSKISHNVL